MGKKYFTTKEVMDKIKNGPKRPTINKELKKHLNLIIDDVFAKKYRKSTMSILAKANKNEIGEFLYYYYSGSHNVVCLVIDSIKNKQNTKK